MTTSMTVSVDYDTIYTIISVNYHLIMTLVDVIKMIMILVCDDNDDYDTRITLL